MNTETPKAATRCTEQQLVGHLCYVCEGAGHYICDLTGHRRTCTECFGTGFDDSDDPYEEFESIDGLTEFSMSNAESEAS
jgi:DnaJ-class molecular chaperone